MRTRLLYFSLLAVLGSACSNSANEPPIDPPSEKRPTTLDLAIPQGLQDLLTSADSATLCTLASLDEFKIKRYPKLKDLDPARLQPLADWYVLAEVELNADETRELVESFKQAYFAGEINGIACFMPHHALRLTKGDRTLEILICFKCSNYKILPGGGSNNVVLKTDDGMEDTWRAIVRKHGLRDLSDKEK